MNRSRLSAAGRPPPLVAFQHHPALEVRFQFSFPQLAPGLTPPRAGGRVSTGSPVSGICSYFRSNIPLPLSIQSSRRDITVSDSLFIVAPFGVLPSVTRTHGGVGQIQKAPVVLLRQAWSRISVLCVAGWICNHVAPARARPERWGTRL